MGSALRWPCFDSWLRTLRVFLRIDSSSLGLLTGPGSSCKDMTVSVKNSANVYIDDSSSVLSSQITSQDHKLRCCPSDIILSSVVEVGILCIQLAPMHITFGGINSYCLWLEKCEAHNVRQHRHSGRISFVWRWCNGWCREVV